jgi:hypothetical protein
MSENSNVAAPIVEVIPSRADAVSGVASAHAPFLYFDGAPTFGFSAGIVSITLEALRFMSVGPQVTRDRVIVAHLRMSLPAAQSLKEAIDGALLMARPAAGSSDNPGEAPKPN